MNYSYSWKWLVGALVGLVAIHALAFALNGSAIVSALVVGAAGLSVLALGVKKLEWAMALVLLELFVGGHGVLFTTSVAGFSFTLRMALFAGLMLAWAWGMWTKRYSMRYVHVRDYPWVVLVLAVIAGSIIGVLNNPFGHAFDDANSYFALLYLLPMISIPVTALWKRQLLGVLAVSLVWLLGSGLILNYLFTHLSIDGIDALYTFVRDARLYEVTLQVTEKATGPMQLFGEWVAGPLGYWYRIFGQSQIVALFGGLVVLAAAWIGFRDQTLPKGAGWMMLAIALVLVLGMSRTFLLALGGLGLMIFVIGLFAGKKRFATLPHRFATIVTLSLIAVALIGVTLRMPGETSLQELAMRTRDTSRDTAVSSRWNLLTPMVDTIKESPFVGHGFGKSVTYISNDPRIIEMYGEVYETYRFEWGYLDLWIKTGVLGLLSVALLLWSYTAAAWYHYKKHPVKWLTIGLYASFLALMAVHVLTPYLNHPIGIGWLVFLIPFFDFEGLQEHMNQKKKTLVKRASLSPQA